MTDQTIIEQAEEAVRLIADGSFYEDYDQSTAALGHLRALLATLQSSAVLPSGDDRGWRESILRNAIAQPAQIS
jgi:hypothetical protein